jgi:hypothetical protein
MISKREYEVVLTFVKYCCKSRMLPATWNEKDRKLIVSTAQGRCKTAPNALLLSIHITYLVFIVFRISGEVRNGAGAETLLLHALFFCAQAFCAIFIVHVLKSPREICLLFNLLENFNQNQGMKNYTDIYKQYGGITGTDVVYAL